MCFGSWYQLSLPRSPSVSYPRSSAASTHDLILRFLGLELFHDVMPCFLAAHLVAVSAAQNLDVAVLSDDPRFRAQTTKRPPLSRYSWLLSMIFSNAPRPG